LIQAVARIRLHPARKENPTVPKKPAYPTKTCPRCSKLIHAAKQSHDCGWSMNSQATAVVKKPGRPTGAGVGGVTMKDIEAVKALVDRMGAVKVQELARVLG
jgi:hypothetical protein